MVKTEPAREGDGCRGTAADTQPCSVVLGWTLLRWGWGGFLCPVPAGTPASTPWRPAASLPRLGPAMCLSEGVSLSARMVPGFMVEPMGGG